MARKSPRSNSKRIVCDRNKYVLPQWKANWRLSESERFCSRFGNFLYSHVISTPPKIKLISQLYLNHKADGAEKKSVFVYIHGGGFTEGEHYDTYHGPDFIMNADHVFVSMHYRVGPFGFLNLGSPDYSGNMGLKDQQVALRWIYDNIENFSGNKDEILLYGMSAGRFHLPST